MVEPAPKIDKRTAADITDQVQELLVEYAPSWQEFELDPVTERRQPKGVSAALIGVFARFAEIITERLNQVPDKNFLAFLNLLGASRLSPQPARVPLTFSLAAGSAVDAIVPAGTQVAAPPGEGEQEPVIFETEQELVTVAATLESVFVRNPNRDQYADYSAINNPTSALNVSAFQGNRSIEHILYLGHNQLLGFEQISNLSLIFNLAPISSPKDPRQLKWEFWDGEVWQDNSPTDTDDDTQNLTQSGTIQFGSINSIPNTAVNSQDNRWLRCRLITPITRSNEFSLFNLVRESQLPGIIQVEMSVELNRSVDPGLEPEMAFTNAVPVETDKSFFPFGEQPKLNDVFYLASTEALSVFAQDPDQQLTATAPELSLRISVENSYLLPTANSVSPDFDLELAWEVWDGTTWKSLGTSLPPSWLSLLTLDPLPAVAPAVATDDPPPAATVQGAIKRGATVTVQRSNLNDTISISPLLEDGRFSAIVPLANGVNVITCTASDPSHTHKAWAVIFQESDNQRQTIQLQVQLPELPIQQDRITLQVEVTGDDNSVQRIRIENGNPPLDENGNLPPGTTNPTEAARGNPLTVPIAEGRNAILIEGLSEGTSPTVLAATTLTIGREPQAPQADSGFADGTFGLRHSGTVTLTVPNSVSQTEVNGQTNYWLRVRLARGDFGKAATYKLKNSLKPEEGFSLVLETFRPPIISQLKLGYQQTLTGLPEKCLTDNNLEFKDFTATNKVDNQPFKPFYPTPEDYPTLYLGFTLPPTRLNFPNRPLSLFARTTDLAYSERLTPISPTQSRKSEEPEMSELGYVAHKFWLTGTQSLSGNFTITILGMRWVDTTELWDITETVPVELNSEAEITLNPEQSRQVEVRVRIPETEPADSDRGWLKLVQKDSNISQPLEYSAVFTTFVGREIPPDRRLTLVWQYWNGNNWTRLTLQRDDSENFTRPGLIRFLAPGDFFPDRTVSLSVWLVPSLLD